MYDNRDSMKFGVMLPGTGPLAGARAIESVARQAERLGFTSLWASDHVAIPLESESRYPGSKDGRMSWPSDLPWLDPFATLLWAAAVTERVHLGTSILVLPLRPTLLVAKMASSLDHLSGGRLLLGVGAGWLAEEFELCGQDFSDRGRRMTEAIRALRACWAPGPIELADEFHSPVPFDMSPKPVDGAGLPVLIGGHCNAALRRVAEVGDGWQPSNLPPELLAERLERLERELEQTGRSMTDVELVVRPGRAIVPSQALVDSYAKLGVNALIADVDYRYLSLEESLAALDDLSNGLGLRV